MLTPRSCECGPHSSDLHYAAVLALPTELVASSIRRENIIHVLLAAVFRSRLGVTFS